MPLDPPKEQAQPGQTSSLFRAFPWIFFFAVWLITFPIYNDLSAPATSYEEQNASDIAYTAKSGSSIQQIVIVSLCIFGLWLLYRYRARIRINRTRATVLVALMAWTAYSGIFATDPALSFRRIVSLFLTIIFAAGCAVRLNPVTLSAFIAGIPALNIIPGIIAELRYGRLHAFVPGDRFQGATSHPNQEAAGLAVSIVLFAWLAWRARGVERITLLAMTGFVGFFLVLTDSRSSMIAVLGALIYSIVVIVLRDYKRLLPGLVAALCLLLGVGGAIQMSLSLSGDSAVKILNAERDQGDTKGFNGRTDLWSELLKYAEKRPLVGYGFGSFWSQARIEDISEDQGWAIEQSHSAYLDEVLAFGFPGALLYVSLLFGSIVVCTIQFFRGQTMYAAWASLLFLMSFHELTESIFFALGFMNFTFYLIVLYLVLRNQPETLTTDVRKLPVRLKALPYAAAEGL